VTEFLYGSNATQTQVLKSLGGSGLPARSCALLGNSEESDEKLAEGLKQAGCLCLARYNIYVGKLRTANE